MELPGLLLSDARKFLAGPVGGWVGRSGFIVWDEESSEEEELPDFVVESEGY